MDGQTENCKTICPSIFRCGGIKNIPNPVYFNPPLLNYIQVLSKDLFRHREIEFHRVYVLWFSTNYDTRGSKYRNLNT